MQVTEWIRSLPRRRPSRIGLRLFAFNLLVVFVPVAGILYLDVYESRLLETQERGMIQLARMAAASIEGGELLGERSMATFARLDDRGDSRIRVYDAQGALVAASRQSAGQRSLTLSSAVPIRSGVHVVGAVVVSQSTFRILQALYDVRLRLFEIVLLSLAVATALTWIASSTIVNPILRLKEGAAALTSRRGGLGGVFNQVRRKDEIGDLARSLEQLAARLDAHIKLLESFAADVAHEFRNPLAAIRTAAETMAESTDEQERQRFFVMLRRDVDRLGGLVSGGRHL